VSLATKLKAGEARERLQKVRARTLELQKRYTADRQAARSHTDPDLSGEGLGRKRQELEQAARQRLEQDVQALRSEAERDLATVRAFAQEDRPKSAASELRQQRLWDRTRLLLESGRTLPQLIKETDDVDTLLAIREEAGVWLRAQSRPVPGAMGQRTEPDLDALLRSVDQRLAQVADGLGGVAVAWGLEADALEAGLKPTLGYLGQEAAGASYQGAGLTAAIQARLAEQEAQRGYEPSESDSDSDSAAGAA
jgi:hypothetical protein